MERPAQICRGHSRARDARQAVCEFHASVVRPETELVVFFCSGEYDLEVLAGEMGRLFDGIQVVGCTTAGEIGPAGYLDHSLAGASFSAGSFAAVSGRLDHLQHFEFAAAQIFVRDLLYRLESRPTFEGTESCFAFLLIDGLSVREEPVTRALQNALGPIPLVGGSAGDGLKFGSAHVYSDGHFHSDCAVLCLFRTGFPIRPFKTQHFVATEERMVVTDADPDTRVVRELNGLPAAQEYARILGVHAHDLGPMQFATSPIVVMIDGTNYVRSVQKMNPDGSLTFFCAIENGIVLRVADGVDLVQNLEDAFHQIHSEIGPPQLVLGCDCILRKIEITQAGLTPRVEHIFLRNNTVGFNTYGEQFRGVHVNQTFAGVAIGTDPLEPRDV